MAESSFPMNGGDSAYSYTRNSQYQRQASDSATGVIQEAIIEKFDTEILLSVSATLRLADFGCSVGPNTFFAMQNLIEAVKDKCSLQGLDSRTIEFQVFFNDSTANDFNTLFASLPQDRKYHAAGAPGSFYGRIFPRASINLAHSSYALHFLSKVPKEVTDSKSTAWNKGRIHYMGTSKDVVKAYSDQFERDIGAFISARAEEIVTGGLMFLIIPGIPEGVCHPAAICFDLLGSCLMDLADEGVVDKTKIDTFNLPNYFPTAGEMTKLIEKNGCFSIERMELATPRFELDVDSTATHLRAALEVFFTNHFGNSVMEKMFGKALARTKEISHLLKAAIQIPNQLHVVLKRN